MMISPPIALDQLEHLPDCVHIAPARIRPGLTSGSGSALIGLVVAILVFSILAAAIVPMIGSSNRQISAANAAANAYLMAESGFRYGASEYLNAGASDPRKNDALENLDGNYTLSGERLGFELLVHSYFYEIINAADQGGGQVRIKAHSPGTFPGDDISAMPMGLKISISGETYSLAGGSQAVVGEDDNVTLFVNSAFSTFPPRTTIYPVADAAVTNPVETIPVGVGINTYNIQCRPGHTTMFPRRNGRVLVKGDYRTYRYNDRALSKLIDIRDPADPYGFLQPFTLLAGEREIALAPFVLLKSTGIYGSGTFATRRTVDYHTPLTLPETATVQTTFTDTFDNEKRDWQDVDGNQTVIRTVDEDSALRVEATTKTIIDGAEVQGSLTKFNPTTPEAGAVDFRGARRGTQGFLSYETQLKVGYDDPVGFADPLWGFFPESPLPAYVAAGLSFRLKDLPQTDPTIFNVNSYGISFMRGTDRLNDGIPDDFVPIQDERIIVLWQQTGNGDSRQWLAYKKMADSFFEADFEEDDQFSVIDDSGWDFNSDGFQRGDSTRNLHIPGNASGIIRSEPIPLPAGIDAAISFWSWHSTEPGQAKQVFIRDNDTTAREFAGLIMDRVGGPGWHLERFDIPDDMLGKQIEVEFDLALPADPTNTLDGWFIDDVKVFYPWPVDDVTVALRLQEALVVPFKEGTARIRQGDRIYGNKFFTAGTVVMPPMLTDGNWTEESKAEGTFLLNRVASVNPGDSFEPGEDLLVTGGTGKAKVDDDYAEATDSRANIIRAYYAASQGSGTEAGNGDPLDRDTKPYGRLGAPTTDPGLIELQWPPDLDDDGNWTDDDGNWTDEEDYFRMLQWDAVNGSVGPELSSIDFSTKDNGLVTDAVIQSRHPDLESPLIFGPLTANPELGLHTFGDGARNVFFDDFGIRLDVSVEDTVPAPVQQ